jgi:excisionase family DNA binding protein
MAKVIQLHPQVQSVAGASIGAPQGGALTDSTLLVTLTVGQLRSLMEETVQNALKANRVPNGKVKAEVVADFLKIDKKKVYQLHSLGKIPGHRIGKRGLRFDLREVEEALGVVKA